MQIDIKMIIMGLFLIVQGIFLFTCTYILTFHNESNTEWCNIQDPLFIYQFSKNIIEKYPSNHAFIKKLY